MADFTDQDILDPIYCIDCKAHVARADLIDDALCGTCYAARALAEVKRRDDAKTAAAAAQRAEADRKLAVFTRDTHRGKCPQCQSTNIEEIVNSTPNTLRPVLMGLGGCTGCVTLFLVPVLALVGAVVFIVGAVQPGIHRLGVSRICQACGHRWLV